MKLSDYKDKIDNYFAEVSTKELMASFEDLGYEFERIQSESTVYQKEASKANKSIAFSAIFDVQTESTELYEFDYLERITFCESVNVSQEDEYSGNRNISMAA